MGEVAGGYEEGVAALEFYSRPDREFSMADLAGVERPCGEVPNAAGGVGLGEVGTVLYTGVPDLPLA